MTDPLPITQPCGCPIGEGHVRAVELVGGSQDGRVLFCEPITHCVTVAGERWEWDGRPCTALGGAIGVLVRRFHLVKTTKETT